MTNWLIVCTLRGFFAMNWLSISLPFRRKCLQIFECLLFETDDLIMRKNEKHVILCLLEVARRGAKFGKQEFTSRHCSRSSSMHEYGANWWTFLLCFNWYAGMLAPMLVQMERQIDREIAADNKANGVTFGTQTDTTQTISTCTEHEEFDSDSDEEEDDNGPMLMYGPQPQIVTNDLKSLDEMVSSNFPFLRSERRRTLFIPLFPSTHKSLNVKRS